VAERDDQGRKHAPVAAWLLLAPGLLWLIWFFFIPLYTLGRMSLSSSPSRFAEPVFNWHWANFDTAFSSFGDQFVHSFVYAVAATLLALVIAYPLAYVIAFRGGRWKNLLLGLVVVPFFTNFLIRTLAWKTILGDQGTLVTFLRNIGLLSSGGTLLRTPAAVVGGLTYNFLPFMILPIYVSLEKIDRRLVEAAEDLYSTPVEAFRKVVLPLSLPGVFAGSLLTFIPAMGDFINAQLLGSPNQQMIGTVIQNQFLEVRDYPLAASLSFVLMAVITLGVLAYARVLGTEDLA
jgi:spermidine/putrescine transport system permease protein